MVLWRRWAGGVVTINGRWPGQPSHMFSFFNPCLTRDEVAQARQTVASKQLVAPIRFIFVGSIAAFKGVEMALQVIDALKRSGISLVFDIIGDGPDLPRYQKLVEGWGLGEVVNFHGWVPRPQLAPYYTRAHFQLLPSRAEGWPKVLSEGMAYGVVPIASAISSIPQILGELGCGAAVPISAEAFIRTVQLYLDEPKRWSIEAERGREAVQRFTYEHYLGELDRIFAQTWNTVPPGIAAE
jgi:glycosyltransferase involved in cell wall biosynthesis